MTHTSSIIEQNVHDILSGSMSTDDVITFFEECSLVDLSVDHLVGGARAMRSAMIPVSLSGDPIDTCGTGGSGKKTINTSTLVAFLVAAAGGRVAKHGNRSASGNCGSFDVLEGLGAQIDLNPEQEQKIYEELGIVFLFARSHHPAMRHVAEPRKLYGKKTLFNYLGPLCNPAGALRQMIGIGNQHDAELILAALQQLGASHATVVSGMDGLDEVSVCAPTAIYSLDSSGATYFEPADFDLNHHTPGEIEGGSIEENVQIIRELAADRGAVAQQHLILANAAHALMLTDIVRTFDDALSLAHDTLHSGKIATLIEQYVQITNDLT